MSDNNNSYRIRTNVGEDSVLNVNINQDFNALEVLSLKLDVDSLYKLHTSNYGCVVGRVLANGGYGIPNAKISIFISADSADLEDDVLSYLYPYKTVNSKNRDRIRYNLLPEDQLSDCHRNVGTFPSKRTVLDDNNVLEVYDKYYKFTTRTNEAGDYMIFGVPVGEQTLHVDIDLSDIGILSQRPRDMVYKGYNITQFENANMFKSSTDLDSLAQVISQNQNVNVYPFWGEDSEGDIAITRRDIDVQYEFTPTCVFIGSVVTDEGSSSISKRCIPSERMGKMDRLTTGNGTIEMIRKTPDGNVEEFIIQGNALIDGNGVWCYQIPMNLDYVKTDEYGNIVRTDDTTKGIPTRASVRFRFSLTEFENEGSSTHVSKVLVPNNPKYYSEMDRKKAEDMDASILDYSFGSATDDASFKDLFSNNVYTAKSFIPRFQMLSIDRNKRFSGFKAINDNGDNNPIPYNNIRVDLTFMFTLQCAVFKVLLWVVGAINSIITVLSKFSGRCSGKKFDLGGAVIGEKESRCLYIGEGYCPEMDGWYFAPKCGNNTLLKRTYNLIKSGDLGDEQSIDSENRDPSENGNKICVTTKLDYFIQCVEINLAMEYNVIQLDFYNDWVNGMLYVPRWQADIRPKRSFFFGLFKVNPRINACMETGYNAIFQRRYAQQCALKYAIPTNGNGTDYTEVTTARGCKNNGKQKCHKSKGRRSIRILDSRTNGSKPGGGVVHSELTMLDKYAYYFRPCEWLSKGRKCNLFATDIVLLGSMEENNSQGIPQTFTKLSSTSFQIPDTLASTNLGVDGFLYGDTSGSICGGPKEDASAQPVGNTFDGVNAWTRGKDFYESSPYDDRETPVTEAAGIDWGYSGPGQGKNSLKDLYFPGGHFLGVSCFNTETNIKSCVNLSRICEAGSMVSQRQSVVSKVGPDGKEYKYLYLAPTGFIGGESINDYGFKNEFATLNYRGLKTKLNKDTLVREYDFETINPINFGGDLYKQIMEGNEKYNEMVGGTTDEYRRTIEENSHDYYRFRLGLPKEYTAQDAKKKYLIHEGGGVSLPVYENSFYFYFGLKGGSTAIDRFYKEFYAECPALKGYEPEVSIEITSGATLCEDNGSAIVRLRNIENFSAETSVGNMSLVGVGTYKIENIPGGVDVIVTVEGSNISTIEKKFMVPLTVPESFSDASYDFVNYSKEYVDLETGSEAGYITFDGTADLFSDTDVIGVLVYTNNFQKQGKPYAKIVNNSNYSGGLTINTSDYEVLSTDSATGLINYKIYAWRGNEEYTLLIFYGCGDVVKEYTWGEEEMTMPEELDIRFNDYKYASYRYIVRPLIEAFPNRKEIISKVWYNIILDSGNSAYSEYRTVLSALPYFADGITSFKEVAYNLAKGLFYENSQASTDMANSFSNYEIIGGTAPYSINIEGSGEKYDNGYAGDANSTLLLKNFTGSSSVSQADAEGYSLSIEQFVSPTKNYGLSGSVVKEYADAPTKNAYFYDYTKSGVIEKEPYSITIEDANGAKIEGLRIPSIYRPFFFRALYLSDYIGSERRQAFSMAVANGVSYDSDNGESPIIAKWTMNGEQTMEDTVHKNYYGPLDSGDTRIDALTFERLYYTKAYSGYSSLLITNGVYNVSVEGKGENAIKEERNIRLKFIGDERGVYDTKARYITINEKLARAILNNLENSNVTLDQRYCAKVYSRNTDPFIPFSFFASPDFFVWQMIWSDLIKDSEAFRNGKYEYRNRTVRTVDEITAKDIYGKDNDWSDLTEKCNDAPYVLGIYDSDYDHNENTLNAITFGAFGLFTYHEPLFGSMNPDATSSNRRHCSNVTIMRIYKSSDFLNLVKSNFN